MSHSYTTDNLSEQVKAIPGGEMLMMCFSCGTCTHCDNCVTYCPDLAVQRAGDGYTVLTDYCKGCGVCVKECPTGSMTMQEELR